MSESLPVNLIFTAVANKCFISKGNPLQIMQTDLDYKLRWYLYRLTWILINVALMVSNSLSFYINIDLFLLMQ